MKLLTYDDGSGPRCGVLRNDNIIDVATLLNSQPLRDVQALLELDDSPLDRVRVALGGTSDDGIPLDSVRLRSPVLRPPTVRDFIVYEEHATGQGTRQAADAWYRMPIFYFSNTLRILGQGDHFPYPSACVQLDYEMEIGCIIGREGTNVSAADGLDYIAGFCIFNDWSCRDLQFDEMDARLGPAKGKDSATTLGPWMVTTDEMAPYLKDGRLQVKCNVTVNGDKWMVDGNGGVAYHTWGDMVERASRDSRIVPGDVFGSGTVGGGSISEAVRKGFDKARYLRPGDQVTLSVEGIGELRGTVDEPVISTDGYRYMAKEQRAMPEMGSAGDYRYELKK